jgi:hypothetical protein
MEFLIESQPSSGRLIVLTQRIIVAVEPLQIVSNSALLYQGIERDAYTAPIARINATETLVRGFITRSHTRKTGRTPNVQSAQADIAECAYVEFVMTLASTQLPATPW